MYGYLRAFLRTGVWEAMRQHLIVRHRQAETEQADDRADQSLGLPVGGVGYRLQRERGQDGER